MKITRFFTKFNASRITQRLFIVPIATVLFVATAGLGAVASAATPNYTTSMLAGQTLYVGNQISSPASGERLLMQPDGNLVLYTQANIALWSSQTGGTGTNNRAVMQTDGNFVVYTSANKAVWSSKTAGTSNHGWVEVQGDGNLVVYAAASTPVWATSTNAAAFPGQRAYVENSGIGHQSGVACLNQNTGGALAQPTYDWCSNAQSGNTYLWYGPYLTMPAKSYNFQVEMDYYWTDSNNNPVTPLDGDQFTLSVTDNSGVNSLVSARIYGSSYCWNSTLCRVASTPIGHEPIENLEIRASNVAAPNANGDILHIIDTAVFTAP